MFRKIILLGAMCCIAVSSVYAGETVESTQKADKLQTNRGLVIEVLTKPNQVNLPGEFRIAFKLQNTSSSPLVLTDLVLAPVDVPVQLRVQPECFGKTKQVVISPEDTLTIVCSVLSPKYSDTVLGFFSPIFMQWSLLTLTPAEYTFVLSADAYGQKETEEAFNVATSKIIPIRLSPTIWQAVAGAMLGSFLMAVFWISSPLVRHKISAGSDEVRGIFRLILNAALLWLGSTVAAAIAIFLTFRMGDASLPFTLSVNDFYGGLVIGLFGIILTNWLAPKLFGEDYPKAAGVQDAQDSRKNNIESNVHQTGSAEPVVVGTESNNKQ